MNTFRQAGIKRNLELRAGIIKAIRAFFAERDFLEVETPVRIPAPAPEAHIDAPASGDRFLHSSPELCMKRLLSAGYPRIFQICRCFRENERGKKHIPEFTLLEWYCAENNYKDLMDQCEDMIVHAASTVGTGNSIVYQGETINLEKPWDRITVAVAFDRYSPVSMEQALQSDRFDHIMDRDIEPNLGKNKPVFLYDYPASGASLARLKHSDSAAADSVAERFELYIGSIELCNGFTELTDPDEQRKRFEKELASRAASGRAVYPMPEKFLEALKSMPGAAGNALGIDRLVMIFADTDDIDDVIAFTPEET